MVFGCTRLLTDRGSAFRSKLVSELCRLLGVKQLFTSSRHPQTNSRCEAYNKNLLSSLRTHCEGCTQWPNLLSTIGHTFRTSVVASFGCSPYRVVFGLDPKIAIDNVLLPSPNLPTNVTTYLKRMDPEFALLRDRVRQNQLEANAKTTEKYNAKVTTKTPSFNISDRVWLHNPDSSGKKLSHKVRKKWVGPYLIVDANNEGHIYKLQHCDTRKILGSWINADRLRLHNTSRDEFYSKNNTAVFPTADVGASCGSEEADEKTENIRSAVENSAAVTADAATGNEARYDLQQQQQPLTYSSSAAHTAAQSSPPAVTLGTHVNGPDTSSEWHEITNILTHRKRGGTFQYRVKWIDGSTSWLPSVDVTAAAVDAYWAAKAQRSPKRRRRKRT